MTHWVKVVLGEPLVHFVILAAGLFALSGFYNRSAQVESQETIVVGRQRIGSLVLTFQRTWQRPPSRQELDGLIEDFVKEEVLYREALAMGLDKDDTLIRRRLRQKLEFVAEDLADTVEPTDEQLQEYLDSHPDSFRVEQRITFRHVYLKPAKRGDSLESDAERLLAQLRKNDGSVDPSELGDPFLLPYFHQDLREAEVASQFGPEFSEALFAIEAGQWQGPIRSAYGAHLVLIESKSAGRLPDLDEVRSAVRREWFAQRRIESKEQFFQTLRKKYKIVIEDIDEPEVDSSEESE